MLHVNPEANYKVDQFLKVNIHFFQNFLLNIVKHKAL